MTRNVRTYEHFCLTARALERVGDRWSLLVVRDLLSGPKRFTDLMERLGGITPKTLTVRLRELEESGILAAERERGRREVWYHLTEAGSELGSIVDALGGWGLRHAWRFPLPGEPLHAEHLLRAVLQGMEPGEPARWQFRLDGEDYLVESDGERWTLAARTTARDPDVTVTAATGALAAFLFAGVEDGIEVAGDPGGRFRARATELAR
ncbi:MAG: helix-turn-helix transcriptional regulator [Nonomuraea sp.]|nr:helix-turn-helix transcriptional regulator [Nonomuraea sp.]